MLFNEKNVFKFIIKIIINYYFIDYGSMTLYILTHIFHGVQCFQLYPSKQHLFHFKNLGHDFKQA